MSEDVVCMHMSEPSEREKKVFRREGSTPPSGKSGKRVVVRQYSFV